MANYISENDIEKVCCEIVMGWEGRLAESPTRLQRCAKTAHSKRPATPRPKLGWLVYEDSFLKWVKSLDGDEG